MVCEGPKEEATRRPQPRRKPRRLLSRRRKRRRRKNPGLRRPPRPSSTSWERSSAWLESTAWSQRRRRLVATATAVTTAVVTAAKMVPARTVLTVLTVLKAMVAQPAVLVQTAMLPAARPEAPAAAAGTATWTNPRRTPLTRLTRSTMRGRKSQNQSLRARRLLKTRSRRNELRDKAHLFEVSLGQQALHGRAKPACLFRHPFRTSVF